MLQARMIYKDGGIEAIRKFEHSLPQKPRQALSHCVDFVKFDQDLFDKFTEKFSFLALNTSLHLDVVRRACTALESREVGCIPY